MSSFAGADSGSDIGTTDSACSDFNVDASGGGGSGADVGGGGGGGVVGGAETDVSVMVDSDTVDSGCGRGVVDNTASTGGGDASGTADVSFSAEIA